MTGEGETAKRLNGLIRSVLMNKTFTTWKDPGANS